MKSPSATLLCKKKNQNKNIKYTEQDQMNSSEAAAQSMVSHYSLQSLMRFDLKPVAFIPINTWIWGGPHVL